MMLVKYVDWRQYVVPLDSFLWPSQVRGLKYQSIPLHIGLHVAVSASAMMIYCCNTSLYQHPKISPTYIFSRPILKVFFFISSISTTPQAKERVFLAALAYSTLFCLLFLLKSKISGEKNDSTFSPMGT